MHEIEFTAEGPRTEVLAVVVNYRTPDLVAQCIESLAGDPDTFGVLRVCVVDNSSGDGSLEAIADGVRARGWSAWVDVVDSGGNLGFSGGNNVGIRSRPARYYWLINSDAYVRPGCLGELLRAMDESPEVGLAGCRLEWPDGEPQQSCFRFRTPLTELVAAAGTRPVSRLLWRHESALPVSESPMDVDWLSFACVMIREDVLREVGLLDEGYFMYFEDMDFCWKARRAGWHVCYVPSARAVHLRGQSGSVKRARTQRLRRPRYYYASRSRSLARLWGVSGLWAGNFLWYAGRAVALLRETLGSKQPHACAHEALDIWTNAIRPLRLDPGDPRLRAGEPPERSENASASVPGVGTSR